jgi:hypothetical protein
MTVGTTSLRPASLGIRRYMNEVILLVSRTDIHIGLQAAAGVKTVNEY